MSVVKKISLREFITKLSDDWHHDGNSWRWENFLYVRLKKNEEEYIPIHVKYFYYVDSAGYGYRSKKAEDALEWCKEHCNGDYCITSNNSDNVLFWFDNESTAMLFKLMFA